MKRVWNVIGMMSGTSLDGLDIAHCQFTEYDGKFEAYKIIKAVTVKYSQKEKNWLSLMDKSAVQMAQADFDFGRFSGQKVKDFVEGNTCKIDLVASHGHTVFHQPGNGFTTQIGNGAAISAICGFPVVSDFRSMDVCLGGQGAPLVPIGDMLLFENYQYCLNLGGIANVSIKDSSVGIKAFDICPVNLILNRLSKEKGYDYDEDGRLASRGALNQSLFDELNELDFYQLQAPKSLGKEWVDSTFFKVVEKHDDSIENKLTTVCHHIGHQISMCLSAKGEMLVTGGGTMNSYLVKAIASYAKDKCILKVPEKELIEFKEALIFAFLGLSRVLNKPNALKSVTGALHDSIGGALYGNTSALI